MNPSKRGFTLVALLVIVAIVALLAAMLLPALAAAKKKSARINCVNNLKQCGLAFRIWEGDKYPMDVSTASGGTMELADGADTFRNFQVMSNELSTPKILVCPNDTRIAAYDFKHFRNVNVSYFVGLDADESHPQRFLDGDRNLTADNASENGILKLVPGQRVSWTQTIHVNNGNLGLADGSVQQYSNSGVREALKNSGDATNVWRISLPE